MTSATLRVVRSSIFTILVIAGVALSVSILGDRLHQQHSKRDVATTRIKVARAYGELPLSFEQNVGQARGGVNYLARGARFSIYLTPTAATLALAPASASHLRVLRINLEGANRDAKVSAGERLPGVSNYFVGSNPANWHSGVPTFAEVKYRTTYPGIDVVYHGHNGRIEFDFDLAPGADPSRIVRTWMAPTRSA